MPLLVVSYPDIAPTNLALIQSFRAEHDPQYSLVEPHFTLVFSVPDFDERRFVEHVRQQAKGFQTVPFSLKCAEVVKAMRGEESYVFLVPDLGYSDIVRLHDRLYEGDLAHYLRLDHPYKPHVTLAAKDNPQASRELADQINSDDFTIEGTIRNLDVISLMRDSVTTLERIQLA